MSDNYIYDELMHYGTPQRFPNDPKGSGRYREGTGNNPFQHEGDFLTRVERMQKSGMTEAQICERERLSSTEYRNLKRKAKNERTSAIIAQYHALQQDGRSRNEIAKILDVPEPTLRSWDNQERQRKIATGQKTADFLKSQLNDSNYIDVSKSSELYVDIGEGVERQLGVSRTKFDEALKILEDEGYKTFTYDIPQVTNPGQVIKTKVLAPPGTKYEDFWGYRDEKGEWVKDEKQIKSLANYISHDGGESYVPKYVYPKSMDSSRIAVRYGDEGGSEKDGLVEIRKGVEDLSLKGSLYSQVRILVDGTHYIKGMAVYSDDIPEGKDIIFNTNKKSGTPLLSDDRNAKQVLKPIDTKDPKNPFGSLIKPIDEGGQHYYIDKNGKQQLSLINKRADEGDWDKWKDTVASQFLGKQPYGLIKKQLNVSKAQAKQDYEEILNLDNPTIKRAMLIKFADQCDKAAEELKAAALPRQKYQVILPLTTIKDTEIYAPRYKTGEKVALVRYPHAVLFEIPILTVNNKNEEGKKMMGSNPLDAVGINSKTAGILSGADFDGDTVMVIPLSKKVNIVNKKPLDGLKDFDPKAEYGGKPIGTFKEMTKNNTQNEMGKISNLITDMTLQGANEKELERAVRHSMVVIDAEKHKLDYKLSYEQNGIAALKKTYQGTYDSNGKLHTAAATLLSRAKNDESVIKRQGQPKINMKGKDWYDPTRPEGALIYKISDKATYVDKKTGKTITRTQRSTQMRERDDARDLISKANTKQEQAYAEYANYMKSLANSARKEYMTTERLKINNDAKREYAEERASLLAKLNVSKKNEPLEREAQRRAGYRVAQYTEDDPQIAKSELRKMKQRALTEARAEVGAKRTPIVVTEREWEAIQKGAISDNQLSQIIKKMDDDTLRKLATPKTESKALSNAKIARIKAMQNAGYPTSEIAEAMGISTSTVTKYLKGS